MLRTLLCDKHNHFLVIQDLNKISDILKSKDHRLWLDMENPTPAEFDMIQDEFKLHPLAIEDARLRHQRPKVDQYNDFYFVVFYAVDTFDQDAPAPPPTVGQGLKGAKFHRSDIQKAAPASRYEPGSLIGTNGHNNSTDTGNATVPTGNGNNSAKGIEAEPEGVVQFKTPLPEEAKSQPQHGQVVQMDGQEDAARQDTGSGAFLTGNSQRSRDVHRDGQGNPERILLHELSMFMGDNYLITVHMHPIPELNEVARRWYRNVVSIKGQMNEGKPLQGTRPLTDPEAKALKIDNGEKEEAAKPVPLTGSGAENAQKARVKLGPDQVDDTVQPGDEDAQDDVTSDMGILLYSLLDTVVDGYFPVLDTLVDRIEDLEQQIFEQFDPGSIEDVFNLKKDMLALRKVLAPERDVLNVLTRRDIPIFEQHTLIYFQDVYDHVVRITDSIDTYRDLISSALDSYLSMQSNRLNITVQTLTSVSIILMTIATFTGWFGMNFEHMNELHTSWGYPAMIVVVTIVVGLEALFFKRKGWF